MFMLKNRAPERFAEGKRKAQDAIGKMEVERLKKVWRKQWEAEQRMVSPEEIRASIEAKIQTVRAQVERERAEEWEQLSEETRAAWNRFEELRDRDLGHSDAPSAD